MVSAIYILDSQYQTLLFRDYRGDIPRSAIEEFGPLIMRHECGDDIDSPFSKPCFTYQGVNYLYVQHNNIYLVVLSVVNTNALQVLFFLNEIVKVFTEYFTTLAEESVRDNFVVIYELLDEMMDFGHPQTTDYKVLQEYITQDTYQLDISTLEKTNSSLTGDKVSWRPHGIFYKKNEMFLDIIESINVLIGTDGHILQNNIYGKVVGNCYLSGMPELKLGLSDKLLVNSSGNIKPINVSPTESGSADTMSTPNTNAPVSKRKPIEMEDVKFHPCVGLDQFNDDRSISFIPPDGKFDLMTYRLKNKSKPLVWVNCDVEVKPRSRILYKVTVKSQFKKRSTATFITIFIPVPQDCDSPKFKTSIGTVVYAPETNCIVWKIKQFSGGKEFTMQAQLQLSSVTLNAQDENNTDGIGEETAIMSNGKVGRAHRPISVSFEIPYLATSGLQVRYLKINEPDLKYPSLPWVRYLTKSGDEYSIRMKKPLSS
ncbi:clathrin adaptor, mu subunit [Nadsonia fulvescens var. elongata DSM 6958]|uniref:Clathrin adaptor, mu subunit n=1 Tax=Nadsonia fulvescens var. elongata DSM 6958 TaxID=857566 RepID=A0A1E3PGC3_9ASCO|nr:clathrin adaptor, mu subunit [Nadsonia fulvescens var. elongata DSM 6958]